MGFTIQNKNTAITGLLLDVLRYFRRARKLFSLGAGLLLCFSVAAQDTRVSARMDANHIMVGDQARLFIDVQHDPATGNLQWATIPDTFNHLEVVERGKIDTLKQGNNITYRQRILIT